MTKPKYNGKRSFSGSFVMLNEFLQASEAWSTMKPGPRALYLELKRRNKGSNNGKLWLSQRDAARAICVSKNTVGAYFEELKARGFIYETQIGYLGPDGMGRATCWALDELPTHDGKRATMRFKSWRKQNPVPTTGIRRTNKRDRGSDLGGPVH